jgi:hypothetical protein
VTAHPIGHKLEQFAGGSRIAARDALGQRPRPFAHGVVLPLVPVKRGVMNGAHETLFVAEVLLRRFPQIHQDGLQHGRRGARQHRLV